MVWKGTSILAGSIQSQTVNVRALFFLFYYYLFSIFSLIKKGCCWSDKTFYMVLKTVNFAVSTEIPDLYICNEVIIHFLLCTLLKKTSNIF